MYIYIYIYIPGTYMCVPGTQVHAQRETAGVWSELIRARIQLAHDLDTKITHTWIM